MAGLLRAVAALGLAGLAACAGPQTGSPEISDAELLREQQKQREVVLLTRQRELQRLWDVAYPILRAATPLCADRLGYRGGFSVATTAEFGEQEWAAAARSVLGLDGTPRVHLLVAGSAAERAGLRAGDQLVGLDGRPLPAGAEAADRLRETWRSFDGAAEDRLRITVRRGEQLHKIDIAPDLVCNVGLAIDFDGPEAQEINASADGEAIVVNAGMMRFVSDDELAAVVGHELAHNVMGHIGKRQTNAVAGAIAGGVLDVVFALGGINTGGAFSKQGAGIGVRSYSQGFESEADYVGLYAVALSGRALEAAPFFWRRMAALAPERIGYGSSHPATAERFLRMEKTIAEIRAKRAQGLSLQPEAQAEPAADGAPGSNQAKQRELR